MITANVIHRVFRICYDGSACTGFTIEIEEREYLVTAKHVFESLGGSDEIDVFSNGDWSPYEVNLVGHAPDDVDITVLAATQRLTPPGLPMDVTHEGLVYGQDVYFLGFPYNFLGKFLFGDSGYPLPFVKKATVSLFDDKIVFLDGHNNRGFSGGPVVFTEPTKRQFKVAADCERSIFLFASSEHERSVHSILVDHPLILARKTLAALQLLIKSVQLRDMFFQTYVSYHFPVELFKE